MSGLRERDPGATTTEDIDVRQLVEGRTRRKKRNDNLTAADLELKQQQDKVMKLGEELRDERKKANLDAQRVAEYLGVAVGFVEWLENGDVTVAEMNRYYHPFLDFVSQQRHSQP